ncbi:MAG: aminotransferase class I/II-fold pyridoxal phosphate-dependent enzyme [Bacillus sp. (in: firmicutes)]
MKKQHRKPLCDALKAFTDSHPISFHVPGHKNGLIIDEDDGFGTVLRIDATEIEGLDDLHDADGVIAEAEQLTADFYQSKKSFFLVNGSTVGNLAMIMGNCHENDVVLVQRNCHKSVMNAIRLAKAKPVFLKPDINEEWGIAEGISLEVATEAMNRYPEAKAIILTYPNYYGVGENQLSAIIKLAHQKGMLVLVDEAHGAHFAASPFFLPSSLEMGADFVVHSAHKTLPAMTMGSYLHVHERVEDYGEVSSYLNMLQSSSPSYPIMASLDAARAYAATYREEDYRWLYSCVQAFMSKLDEIEGIKVLKHKTKATDILKITVQADGGFNGYELQEALLETGVFTEMADPMNVLFIFPLLKMKQNYPTADALQRIKEALRKLNKKQYPSRQYPALSMPVERVSELAFSAKEMEDREREYISLTESAGRVAGEAIIPYPPGVPFILRGELITAEHIIYIEQIMDAGARIQGASKLQEKLVLVYK